MRLQKATRCALFAVLELARDPERQISALESNLKVPLFHRHARGLILTEQGELLYRTAHEVFGRLAMVEAQLAESKDRPKGPLRITTGVSFGATWLAPRIHEFMEMYPTSTPMRRRPTSRRPACPRAPTNWATTA